MFNGLLIKESLRNTDALKQLVVTRTETHQPENAAKDQSPVWTFVYFSGQDEDAERQAETLATNLKAGKWYTNLTTGAGEVFVIFSGKFFRYKAGNVLERQKAQDYALAIGIPPDQLDWEE